MPRESTRRRTRARDRAMPGVMAILTGLLLTCATGCQPTQPTMPPVQAAAVRYRNTVESDDAAALHALLDRQSRKHLTVEQVAAMLQLQRQELRAHAKAVAPAAGKDGAAASNGPAPAIWARARVALIGGGEAALLLEDDGTYHIEGATGLPPTATSPRHALKQLRAVLARKSLPALLPLLSADTRRALEAEIAEIIEGLEHPDQLVVDEKGDEAKVLLNGGHRVTLRRVDGVWKVHDVD